MLSVTDTLLLTIKKHRKYKICVMYLVSHPEINLILFGWSAIQPVCLYGVYLFVPFHLKAIKSPLFKKCFSDLNLYEVVRSSGLVVQFADVTNS